jgi:hypothetical protein
MKYAKRWLVVVVYAAAMAWVESAVVFYLRTMVDRIEPHQPNPLPLATGLGKAELVREAATIVMLLAVGILAGRTWRSRLGYFAVAFGVWDIFYYVFLKVICGWPRSLLDWDVLFLIPMPWWGPVLAPGLIALLMVLWGTLQSGWRGDEGQRSLVWSAWFLSAIGMGFALYTFMADNLRVAHLGLDAWRKVVPSHFNWSLFCVGLLLMAAPLVEMVWRWRVAEIARRPKQVKIISPELNAGRETNA